jgi:hypothetical protein
MNRLDRHVGAVRNKLALEKFLLALGYAIALFFALVLAAVLVDRFFWLRLPRGVIWFWAGAVAAITAAMGVAIARRPTEHQAAAFIDEKLGLKEKFSTALFARAAVSRDAFALAAIQDAEQTADNVSLHRRFPIAFPVSAYIAITAGAVVLIIALFLPRFDLFGRQAKLALAQHQALQRQQAQEQAKNVLASVNSLPPALKNQQKVELAKSELQHVLDQPLADPSVVKLTAMKAQEEAETAKQEEIKTNQAYAQAMADKAVFNSLNPGMDDKGPVADASRAIANADFSKAVDALQSLPQKFGSMTPEEQKKATDQMKAVAQQLQKIANDPAAMQNLQQQLQQQGISQQQIQQAAKAVQQAAQGNQQAAQQLQQIQQQMMQQMNGGKGATQQQQSAIAKAMQQMQSVAGSQMKAQQMTSGAQQMVQGMQMAQAARQGAAQAGQPKSGAQQQSASAQQGAQQSGAQQGSSQQANGSQSGGKQSAGQQGASQQSGGQQSGQQAGGQQPGGQQSGQQPGGQQQQASGQQPGGQQPGGHGQGGQGAQQQMQQAGQQMAQALGEMDAVQKDAEQQQVAKDTGDQAGDGGDNSGDGQGGHGGNHGQGGRGAWKAGQPGQGPGGGMGGPGGGGGGGGQMTMAQYSVKQVLDPSQSIASGKVLAKTFVKADQVIGKSTIELSPAAKSALKDSTDDVSEESVPKDAQKAVKDYFDTVGN